MITMILLILEVIFYFAMFLIFYNMAVKMFDNENNVETNISNLFKKLFNQIKEGYERFRQYFCKKSTKVNSDRGTIHDTPEVYDSSSEWQD